MFLVLSIAMMLGGLATMQAGDIHYSNYWGGAVFAPFAIVAGLLLMIFVLFAWRKFAGSTDAPALEGKAARRARQAEETRFPIDDYEKW